MYLGEFVSALRVSADTPATWGWRVWRLVWEPAEQNWLLVSSAHDYRWLSPIVCNAGPPRAGFSIYDTVADGSDAGFFAFKARTIAQRLLSTPIAARCSLALGAVQAVGTVMEHEFGYRSQGVVVRELEVMPTLSEMLAVDQMKEDLVNRYRCDVRCNPAAKPAEAPVGAKRLRMALGITG